MGLLTTRTIVLSFRIHKLRSSSHKKSARRRKQSNDLNAHIQVLFLAGGVRASACDDSAAQKRRTGARTHSHQTGLERDSTWKFSTQFAESETRATQEGVRNEWRMHEQEDRSQIYDCVEACGDFFWSVREKLISKRHTSTFVCTQILQFSFDHKVRFSWILDLKKVIHVTRRAAVCFWCVQLHLFLWSYRVFLLW